MPPGPTRATVALLALVPGAVSCTTPDFRFRSDVPAPDASVLDGGTDADAADAAPPPPAQPIPPIELEAGDFATACNAISGGTARVFTYVGRPTTGPKHCYVYFASDPHRRTWMEARTACGAITGKTPVRVAHLATFPTEDEAVSLQNDFFRAGQIPWIGLVLTNASAPTAKASFTWVTNEPVIYDGWVAGTPGGGTCVTWAGASRWSDAMCETQKGFLCELDE